MSNIKNRNTNLSYTICLDTRKKIEGKFLIYTIGHLNLEMCKILLTYPQLALIRETLQDGYKIELGYIHENWEINKVVDFTTDLKLIKNNPNYVIATRFIPLYGSERSRVINQL